MRVASARAGREEAPRPRTRRRTRRACPVAYRRQPARRDDAGARAPRCAHHTRRCSNHEGRVSTPGIARVSRGHVRRRPALRAARAPAPAGIRRGRRRRARRRHGHHHRRLQRHQRHLPQGPGRPERARRRVDLSRRRARHGAGRVVRRLRRSGPACARAG